MKSYVMTFDSNTGNPKFLDQTDKGAYELLLSTIKKHCANKNIPAVFVMTISLHEEKTTEKQVNLFKALIGLISVETGNDYKTVETTLVNQFSPDGTHPDNMAKDKFSVFLESTFVFAQDFFGINIELDDNNYLSIKKL